MRFVTYSALSGAVFLITLLNAYAQYPQFYTACVYLVQSNANLLVLYNVAILTLIGFGVLLKAIFFGQLRSIETEHVYERSWFALTETCLAMTVFREEFNLKFFVNFSVLLLVKIFHWIFQDRVEYVEQTPRLRTSFHIRVTSLLALLFTVDGLMALRAVHSLKRHGPSMMIIFAFEYSLMMITLFGHSLRYAINVGDQLGQIRTENKSTYLFYIELITDFVRLSVYVCFFAVIMYHYGMPIHIVRDLLMTVRNLFVRFRDLIQYRRAVSGMKRYPDATPEELARVDNMCIVCREEMTAGKKLLCGHIFHEACLRAWLERQQVCPTCRTSVFESSATRSPPANAAPVPPAAAAAAAAAAVNVANAPATPILPAANAPPTVTGTPLQQQQVGTTPQTSPSHVMIPAQAMASLPSHQRFIVVSPQQYSQLLLQHQQQQQQQWHQQSPHPQYLLHVHPNLQQQQQQQQQQQSSSVLPPAATAFFHRSASFPSIVQQQQQQQQSPLSPQQSPPPYYLYQPVVPPIYPSMPHPNPSFPTSPSLPQPPPAASELLKTPSSPANTSSLTTNSTSQPTIPVKEESASGSTSSSFPAAPLTPAPWQDPRRSPAADSPPVSSFSPQPHTEPSLDAFSPSSGGYLRRVGAPASMPAWHSGRSLLSAPQLMGYRSSPLSPYRAVSSMGTTGTTTVATDHPLYLDQMARALHVPVQGSAAKEKSSVEDVTEQERKLEMMLQTQEKLREAIRECTDTMEMMMQDRNGAEENFNEKTSSSTNSSSSSSRVEKKTDFWDID